MNIEGTATPPGEGDGSGAAATLRLIVDPPTATLGDNVTVSVVAVNGGSVTAIGKFLFCFHLEVK